MLVKRGTKPSLIPQILNVATERFLFDDYPDMLNRAGFTVSAAAIMVARAFEEAICFGPQFKRPVEEPRLVELFSHV